MLRAIASVGIASALAVFSAQAGGAVLYQQVAIDPSDRGAYSDDCQQIADDFVPVTGGVPTQVTWQGSYYYTDNPNPTESFKVRLFVDNAGLPANAHFFELSAPASKAAAGTLIGRTLYNYSMTIPAGPTLVAGTTYWIAINTNEPCSNYAWTDSGDGPAGVVAVRSGDAGLWIGDTNEYRDNHVFALTNDAVVVVQRTQVPVPLFGPGALALLGLLVAGAAALRLRAH